MKNSWALGAKIGYIVPQLKFPCFRGGVLIWGNRILIGRGFLANSIWTTWWPTPWWGIRRAVFSELWRRFRPGLFFHEIFRFEKMVGCFFHPPASGCAHWSTEAGQCM